MFIGALDESFTTSRDFIASHSYYHDTLTWCVQTRQPIPIHKTIPRGCKDIRVWIIYTVMCFSVIFTGYFLQQFEDLEPKWDWFRITIAAIGPCLGVVSEYRPQILPNRIFFICCIFGAFLIYIITSSFWLYFTANPIFEKQISSVHEIVNGNFQLAGDGFALQHLMKQNEVDRKFSFIKLLKVIIDLFTDIFIEIDGNI